MRKIIKERLQENTVRNGTRQLIIQFCRGRYWTYNQTL